MERHVTGAIAALLATTSCALLLIFSSIDVKSQGLTACVRNLTASDRRTIAALFRNVLSAGTAGKSDLADQQFKALRVSLKSLLVRGGDGCSITAELGPANVHEAGHALRLLRLIEDDLLLDDDVAAAKRSLNGITRLVDTFKMNPTRPDEAMLLLEGLTARYRYLCHPLVGGCAEAQSLVSESNELGFRASSASVASEISESGFANLIRASEQIKKSKPLLAQARKILADQIGSAAQLGEAGMIEEVKGVAGSPTILHLAQIHRADYVKAPGPQLVALVAAYQLAVFRDLLKFQPQIIINEGNSSEWHSDSQLPPSGERLRRLVREAFPRQQTIYVANLTDKQLALLYFVGAGEIYCLLTQTSTLMIPEMTPWQDALFSHLSDSLTARHKCLKEAIGSKTFAAEFAKFRSVALQYEAFNFLYRERAIAESARFWLNKYPRSSIAVVLGAGHTIARAVANSFKAGPLPSLERHTWAHKPWLARIAEGEPTWVDPATSAESQVQTVSHWDVAYIDRLPDIQNERALAIAVLKLGRDPSLQPEELKMLVECALDRRQVIGREDGNGVRRLLEVLYTSRTGPFWPQQHPVSQF